MVSRIDGLGPDAQGTFENDEIVGGAEVVEGEGRGAGELAFVEAVAFESDEGGAVEGYDVCAAEAGGLSHC